MDLCSDITSESASSFSSNMHEILPFPTRRTNAVTAHKSENSQLASGVTTGPALGPWVQGPVGVESGGGDAPVGDVAGVVVVGVGAHVVLATGGTGAVGLQEAAVAAVDVPQMDGVADVDDGVLRGELWAKMRHSAVPVPRSAFLAVRTSYFPPAFFWSAVAGPLVSR